MAKNNTDPRYKQFYTEFKAGLVGAESGGDYAIRNPLSVKKYGKNSPMVAIGKYQMVPKYQWEDIKKVAKMNNRPIPKNYDEYLQDKALQELHFDWYAENKIWPTVKRDSTKAAKAGLSMGEYGYYNHFEPSAAKKFIATGKHREATKLNPGGNKIIENFRKHRNKNGVQAYYGYSDDELRGEYFHYNARLKKIDENENYSDEVKAAMKQELYDKYRDEGYITPNTQDGSSTGFNRIIDEINRGKEEEYNNDMASIQEEMELLKNATILYNPTDKGAKGLTFYYTPWNSDDAKKLKEFKEKNPGVINRAGHNGLNEISPKFIKNFEKKYENLTGEKLNLLNADLSKGKDLAIDVNKFSSLGNKFGELFGEKTAYQGTAVFEKEFTPKKDVLQKINSIEYIPPAVTKTEEVDTENQEGTTPVNPADATSRELVQGRAEDTQKEPELDTSDADLFFKDKEDFNGDVSNEYKNNFPWASVLGNAAGAIMGMKMADKKIPMRDEQVSGAFMNYAAELKKISERGLGPEEEAYAKRMLTESYNGSIDQLVKASGGNRNLVLGNLGRVDAQKNKSLMELAVADASAKTDALYKYGEAMKYINDFDARRDIANNERKYKDVLMTKEAGAKLAQASFAGLMDTIEDYQANKPGSINHAYKSYMYRELLGYDPQLKDDGSGNIKYTFSWFKKNNQELAKKATEHNEIRDMYWGMTKEEKSQMNQFMLDNNFEGYKAYAEKIYANRENPNVQNQEEKLEPNEVMLDMATPDFNNEIMPNGSNGMLANFGTQQYPKEDFGSVLSNEHIKPIETKTLENQEQKEKSSIFPSDMPNGYVGNEAMFNTDTDNEMLQKYPANTAYQNALKNHINKGGAKSDFMNEEEFTEIYNGQF